MEDVEREMSSEEILTLAKEYGIEKDEVEEVVAHYNRARKTLSKMQSVFDLYSRYRFVFKEKETPRDKELSREEVRALADEVKFPSNEAFESMLRTKPTHIKGTRLMYGRQMLLLETDPVFQILLALEQGGAKS